MFSFWGFHEYCASDNGRIRYTFEYANPELQELSVIDNGCNIFVSTVKMLRSLV